MSDGLLVHSGEESPTTHLDSPIDESTMSASGYAQVVFHNVQERYPPGVHIECRYTLTLAINPASRDWVGIFKVGWSSTRQYMAFDWAPYPGDDSHKNGRECEQNVMFNSYYLPKEEDGEFYQFCYIDFAGKMRGASTPFQFLDRSAEEFVEYEDASMGLMMIQTKTSAYEEQLKRILKEKDELLQIQSDLSLRDKDLCAKIGNLEHLLLDVESSKSHVEKDFQSLKEDNALLTREKTIVEGRLGEVLNALSSLEQDKARCEKALASIKNKLQEAQSLTAKVTAEKDQLVKDLSQVLHERDEFKSQFASSESAAKDLRNEVAVLMHQLSESSQATQDIKEQEGHTREEKRRVEQLLLVANSDKDHLRSVEHKMKQKDDQYTRCELSRQMLCEEIDTMKSVHHKLSNDLQRAETDKDALKSHGIRQEKEWKEREGQLKGQARLAQHQAREKILMLEEQVQTHKGSIKQLAEEKEQALRSNKGPMEASQVVMKKLQENFKKAQTKLEEENKKRVELQKKYSTLEVSHAQETSDLEREIKDLKIRLSMGAEEYRKKYLECISLENKLVRKRSRSVSQEDKRQPTKESVQGRSSPSSPRAGSAVNSSPRSTPDKSADIEELQSQVYYLAKDLEDRDVKLKNYISLYKNEKERRAEQERAFQKERAAFEMQLTATNSLAQDLDEKEDINRRLLEKLQQLQGDYLKMKHSHEVFKFDVQQSANATGEISTPPQTSPIRNRQPAFNPAAGTHPPPPGQLMFRNPYEGHSGPFPNPYLTRNEARPPPSSSYKPSPDIFPRQRRPKETAPVGKSVVVSSAKVTSASTDEEQSSPPLAKRMIAKGPLPEPLKPDVLPEAKIAAIKNVVKKTRLLDLGQEEEREEGPSEFHDACEDFLPGEVEGDGEVMICPECGIGFPPTFSDDEFVSHIQQHYARLCPICNMLMPNETSNENYERHVQIHFEDE